MKNKKIINLMIFVFSIIFAFFISFKIYEVKADSGFDSSWDSGSSFDSGSSWDSGSSYDSDSSWSSGSSGGSSNFRDIKGMALFFELFSSIHWYLFVLRPFASIFVKDKKKSSKLGFVFLAIRIITLLLLNNTFPELFLIDFVALFPLAFGFAMFQIKNNKNFDSKPLSNEEILSKLGDNFNIQEFYNETFRIYKDVQIAWMDIDIERVRNILSDEMFNTYKMQLETLKVKNQKNMMEDINLVDVYITNISQKDNKDVIDVIMKVTCRDYLIDNSNGNVLRGDKNKVWNYEYKLSYMRTNISNELNYCPNCGAKLESGSSVKCSYCNAVINKETNKFILIDKKMLNQR